MKQYFYPSFWIVIFIGTFTSCRDYDLQSIEIPEESKSITITLSLPNDISSSSTRGMTEQEEQHIETIKVLAFLNKGTDYNYVYNADGYIINRSGNTTIFQVDLKPYGQDQRFLILANAPAEIELSSLRGKTIEESLETLIVYNPNEWEANNNNSGIIRPIPMFTLTSPVNMTEPVTALGNYDMIRMLARIDIQVTEHVGNFYLTGAYLFNRMDRGYIGYMMKDKDEDGGKDKDKDDGKDKDKDNSFSYTSATIPPTVETIKSPSVYYEATDNQIIGSIYTFEAKGTGNTWLYENRQNATAIIFGGYFGYPENQTKETYYRIDIPEYYSNGTPKPGTMGDILRNHLYDIKVTGISEEGAETPWEAFNEYFKLTISVISKSLRSYNVIFNKQYNFNISHTKVDFPSKQANSKETVNISTDHPEGIYIENIPTWITVSGIEPGSLSNTLLITTTQNSSGASRKGSIKISAGNFQYLLAVTQGTN